jgi:hypothetical protein
MKIELIRSGGFAGTRMETSVDTSNLSADEAERIQDLVRRLDLDALRRQASSSRVSPDEFQYDLTVIEGDSRQRLRLSESALTPELRTLLDLLVRRARER